MARSRTLTLVLALLLLTGPFLADARGTPRRGRRSATGRPEKPVKPNIAWNRWVASTLLPRGVGAPGRRWAGSSGGGCGQLAHLGHQRLAGPSHFCFSHQHLAPLARPSPAPRPAPPPTPTPICPHIPQLTPPSSPSHPTPPHPPSAARAAIGTSIAAVAQDHGVSVAELIEMLRTDNDIGFDTKHKKLVFACEGLAAPDAAVAAAEVAAAEAAASVGAGDPDPTDLTLAFKLHSRPGAAKKLVLDFTGHTATGTVWNPWAGLTSIVTPPFDTDGNQATFSDAERRAIIATWRQVAEDYAAFNVSLSAVCCVLPGAALCALGGFQYVSLFEALAPPAANRNRRSTSTPPNPPTPPPPRST
jgi:hypothetical protein